MAGKKKGKKKGKKRTNGKKTARRKPIQRGIMGKVGAFILGAGPPAIAMLEAGQSTFKNYKEQNLSMIGGVFFGFTRFLNNITNGLVGVKAFGDPMNFAKKDGGVWRLANGPGSGLPKGSLLYVAASGLLMMAFDAAASKLAGGRPVKVIGTNFNAIGGS
jgi:hypothetical protein